MTQHRLLVLFSLLLAVAWIVTAQQQDYSNSDEYANKIVFSNEVVDTDQEQSENLEQIQTDTQLRQFLIHVKSVSKGIRKQLEKDFGENAEAFYIPHNTFVMIATREQAKIAVNRNKHLIKWVSEQKHYRKISPDLWLDMKQNHTIADPIEVLVIPTSKQTIEQIAQQWAEGLKKNGINSAQIIVTSPKKLTIALSQNSEAKPMLEFIAKMHTAKHVQRKEMFATLQEDFTDDTMVLADMNPLGEEYKTLVLSAASVLQSKDEKEWIGQPGLPDVQFLWQQGLDGEGEVIGIGDTGLDYNHCAFHDPNGTVPFNKVDLKSHRKLVSYWTLGDDKDVVNGHGTHVNSIAAAHSKEHPMLDGVAPKAKIAFIDVGTAAGLRLPNDLSTDYFPLVYKATPIVSNSWGNRRYGQYTLAAREIDDFAWKHRDFLPLYAAGNSGREGGSTLTPPGTAKNALTVGAIQGTYRGFELGLPLYAELLKDQMKQQLCGNSGSSVICNKLKTTKDCCNNDMMKRFCCTKFLLEKLKQNPQWFNPDNVAVFSSRGPTKDNRLKPELLAHGQPVFGARSDGTSSKYHCTTPLVMQGTSQATPIVAAFAVMARQYYKKGFYPTGKPNPKHGFNPSGALLKATLINSGMNVPGLVDLNGQDKFTQVKPLPSFTQGFGKVSLPNTLKFEKSSNFTLFKEEAELSTGDSHNFCFMIARDTDKPFKSTLVWMDYPASPNAAITLVNNLDLLVTSQTGKVYNGNGGVDHTNNVEQVMISPAQVAGKVYKITVRGSRIPHGPQPYALVVTGQMEKVQCDKYQFVESEKIRKRAPKKRASPSLRSIARQLLRDVLGNY